MQNLYLLDPYQSQLETAVSAVRTFDDGLYGVSLEQTIIRPGGGGQPADRARINVGGEPFDALGLMKADGRVWVQVAHSKAWEVGAPVVCTIDGERRKRLTRCHTLTHLLMASLKHRVAGYASCGAEIEEDETTCRLWFDGAPLEGAQELAEVDMFGRSIIAQDLPIGIRNVKSPEAAQALYPYWRVDPTLGLTGKIRVVDIPGVDANPCSGTHCLTTGEIGPYAIEGVSWRRDKNCNELVAKRHEVWTYWYGDGRA